MKSNTLKFVIVIIILFGYYLITNEFPPFWLLIIAVIFLGLGNTHLWGEKNPNKKSFIQRWYGISDEKDEVKK
jgi:chromate transport protein ChrA